MLKTRRQRSFWARIKLSIILFQTPRRVSDLNNFKPVPFLIFRNVDLWEKKNNSIRVIIHHSKHLFFPSFFVLRLFSLPKIIALWLFLLSLPFNFKDQLRALHCSSAPQAKKNVSQNCLFCQAPFVFFYFYFFKFFFHSSKTEKIKASASLPPSHRNIKKNNQLLLLQPLFGIINTYL